LRMLGGDVLESLSRVAELECFEHEVDVNPVMCLLPKGTTRERIADIEDVAVNLLVRVLGKVLC
jgi:hypothetical protein